MNLGIRNTSTSRWGMLLVAFVLVGFGDGRVAAADSHDGGHEAGAFPGRTRQAIALHDELRLLLADHTLWQRALILGVTHDLPDQVPSAQRLTKNGADIGNTFRRYYGDSIGNQLSQLLAEQVVITVDLLHAAKAADADGAVAGKARWHANGDAIATVLSQANGRRFPFAEEQQRSITQFTAIEAEAVARLSGDYAGDIAGYDVVRGQFIEWADFLSDGIVEQFPHRFIGRQD